MIENTKKCLDSINECLMEAEQHCQRQGSKFTQMRKQVLSLLLNAEKAISAYELIDLFEHTFNEKMAPMSIYRILDYLESMQLVHKINVANKFVACSHIGHQEKHSAVKLLFCQQCQRVKETPLDHTIHQCLTDEVQQSGFQLRSEHIELSCICMTCSET